MAQGNQVISSTKATTAFTGTNDVYRNHAVFSNGEAGSEDDCDYPADEGLGDWPAERKPRAKITKTVFGTIVRPVQAPSTNNTSSGASQPTTSTNNTSGGANSSTNTGTGGGKKY